MTLPSWAYQVENFDPPPSEELVCSVCRGVFCDPIQTPCEHVFCRTCLMRWLQNNQSCPICRKRTTRNKVKEVVQLIKNMIMKLTLRCGNWENNCREKFTLEACEAHVRTCPYEMIQCKNKPCLKMFLRKDIRDHELKTCVHRTVRCMTCFLRVHPNMKNHDCIPALRRKLKSQDEDLKKKNKKIKELQKQVKKLETTARRATASDLSSFGSLSADDIMIDFNALSSLSDNSSVDSLLYDSDGDEISWFDFGLREPYGSDSTLDGAYGNDHSNEDSSEFPLNTSSFWEADMSGSVDEEPVVRRPNKRRHPVQNADSSDDNNGDSEQINVCFPSPKRSWNAFRRLHETPLSPPPRSSNDGENPDRDAAGPSHASSYGSAAAAAPGNKSVHRWLFPRKSSQQQSQSGADSACGSNAPGRQGESTTDVPEECKTSRSVAASASVAPKPSRTDRIRRRTRNQSSSHPSSSMMTFLYPPTSELRANPGFERTISLLEQYNLESDDEWVPTREGETDDSSISNDSSVRVGDTSYLDVILPFRESSNSDSSFFSSTTDSPVRENWFDRLYDSPSDDPDWVPQEAWLETSKD